VVDLYCLCISICNDLVNKTIKTYKSVPNFVHVIQFYIKDLCVCCLFLWPLSEFICVLCGSDNKLPLFPYTELTAEFYNRDGECLLRGTG
jgi:hypothetical protein